MGLEAAYLATLAATCSIGDPVIPQALMAITGGNPLAVIVQGKAIPGLSTVETAAEIAVREHRAGKQVRVGIAAADPARFQNATAAFDPCINLAEATREFAEIAGEIRGGRVPVDSMISAFSRYGGGLVSPEEAGRIVDQIRASPALQPDAMRSYRARFDEIEASYGQRLVNDIRNWFARVIGQ